MTMIFRIITPSVSHDPSEIILYADLLLLLYIIKNISHTVWVLFCCLIFCGNYDSTTFESFTLAFKIKFDLKKDSLNFN